MPFARVSQRGPSHGKSHAGTLSPLPTVRGFGHARRSLERYTGGIKFEDQATRRLNSIGQKGTMNGSKNIVHRS